ncbi:GRAM protein, partial [Dromaius novaehollandiae]|nr:GRAM protein [Dromaius novaehollandiae]
VIGGHEAEPHSRPYMVSIQLQEVHACGGALVHKQWVLTAAHCLSQTMVAQGKVVVGLHSLKERRASGQSFAIRKACPHPGYSPMTMENDILLLQVGPAPAAGSGALRQNPGLGSPPPLAPASPSPLAREAAPFCWEEPCRGLAGGRTGAGGSEQQGEAPWRHLQVTVLDARMCNNSRFWNGEIGPTMICFQGCQKGSAPSKVRPVPRGSLDPAGGSAGHEPASVQGDSGGPLVCGKKAAVAGVISFTSRNLTDPFKPPVATSAVKHRKWIRKTLRAGC